MLANSAELTYENVVAVSDRVILVDMDEKSDLTLYSYTKCTNADSPMIKNCRSLVFTTGETGPRLVSRGFPYADEYTASSPELPSVLADFKSYLFTPAYEGTLLRMFFHNGKWYLTTNRKLSAYHSKWSSKDSFGTIFEKALESLGMTMESLQGKLCQDRQYMFLVRNTFENRIVSDPPQGTEPKVYHVGTFVSGQSSLYSETERVTIPGFPGPSPLKFPDLPSLLSFVCGMSPKKFQGVIAHGPDGTQIKILNDEYHKLAQVRGNCSSVKFRYLEGRMDRDTVTNLYAMYPEMIPVFEEYESILHDIAGYIHKAYLRRFVTKPKQYVTLPTQEYAVMSACHEQYLINPRKNQVTLAKVIAKLNEQPATRLNRMIRRNQLDKKKRTHAHPRSYNNSVNNSPAVIPAQLENVQFDMLKLNEQAD